MNIEELRLEKLIDIDSDYKFLISSVSKCTDSIWPKNAEELLRFKKSRYNYDLMDIDTFFANYKADLFFICAISKLFEAVRAKSQTDHSSLHKLTTTGNAILYKNDFKGAPIPIQAWGSNTGIMSAKVDLIVYNNIESRKGEVIFSREFTPIELDTSTPIPVAKIDYLATAVNVTTEQNMSILSHSELIKLKDLNKSELLKVIERSKWL